MRPPKFRAWYTKGRNDEGNTGAMWSWDAMSTVICDYIAKPDEEIILMQFTGRLDKNGVEIYEGDILNVGEELIEEVKWVDETNWMGDKCPVNGWVNHQSIYKKPVEVIGNIYQNSHLLKT